MKTITKIGVVGGLLAALGVADACRKDYTGDVEKLANSNGWYNPRVTFVRANSGLCENRVDLFMVQEINPDGIIKAEDFVCCGSYSEGGCSGLRTYCDFMKHGGN